VPKSCSNLVILPVGPGTNLPFLLDTLESIRRFSLPDHQILVADDSAEGLGDQVREKIPLVDVFVLRAKGGDATRSVAGRFTETMAKIIRHSLENYDFASLMRMDCDALMCNAGADERGIAMLRANPKLGQIGSYRVRCDDQPRDFKRNADILDKEMGFQLLPAKKALAASLNSLVKPALQNGYEMGENIIAPGSMTSRLACEKMAAHPLFGDPSFRPTRLGDDHLNSLLLKALGFDLGDFATGDLPLGVWLRKIEWSPEELVARGKCIVHSIRGYQDLNEEQVRTRFRVLRES
jgi:hypothetical protein